MEQWQDRVRRLMNEQNINGKQLAKKIGVSPQAFSKWMTNKADCRLEYRIKIAKELGVTLHQIGHGIDILPDENHTLIIDHKSSPDTVAKIHDRLQELRKKGDPGRQNPACEN